MHPRSCAYGRAPRTSGSKTSSFFGFPGLGAFIAATFAGLFIGTFALGSLADRFGRRPVFTLSLLWYLVATIIVEFQTSATGLNVWRLITGISIGIDWSPSTLISPSWFRPTSVEVPSRVILRFRSACVHFLGRIMATFGISVCHAAGRACSRLPYRYLCRYTRHNLAVSGRVKDPSPATIEDDSMPLRAPSASDNLASVTSFRRGTKRGCDRSGVDPMTSGSPEISWLGSPGCPGARRILGMPAEWEP